MDKKSQNGDKPKCKLYVTL